MILRLLIYFFFSLLVFISCKPENNYFPKPRIYPRIDFPEKSYSLFESADCPFSMNVPVYFQYKKDSLSLDEKINTDCWFDLTCEPLNASFHLSYLTIGSRNDFDNLVNDAFELVDKHNVKANYRDERSINIPDKEVYGITFEIDGPVAAPLQFFLTDSTRHFLRGSLYFKTQVNRDSLAPVYEYIRDDFKLMVESFLWKD